MPPSPPATPPPLTSSRNPSAPVNGQSTTPPQPPSDGPAVAKLRPLLGTLLRVTTTEGRIFLGTFAGTDKPLNLVLVNAEEYRVPQTLEDLAEVDQEGRYVGQILVPWRMVSKVEGRAGEVGRGRADQERNSMYI